VRKGVEDTRRRKHCCGQSRQGGHVGRHARATRPEAGWYRGDGGRPPAAALKTGVWLPLAREGAAGLPSPAGKARKEAEEEGAEEEEAEVEEEGADEEAAEGEERAYPKARTEQEGENVCVCVCDGV
jgi:hypothetical protein